MSEIDWSRYPLIVESDLGRRWLQIQSDLGLARNTVEAYGRGLEEYFRFVGVPNASPVKCGREQIAGYVRSLATKPGADRGDAAVRNGLANGVPWKYYDLGHGYCTYDFFDQCPHRMACAKCSFYQPKDGTAAFLLEGKNNLLRMRQEIPLGESEIAALDDGVSALDSLLNRLANVPTPAGPTPRQLRDSGLVQIEQLASDD